jgi:hypothetical protein
MLTNIIGRIRHWLDELQCSHDYEYQYWTDGIRKICLKCGKTKYIKL